MESQFDNDMDIMRSVVGRDKNALHALYTRYGRTAFALSYRMTGEATMAEDIVQDAFIRIWNDASSFDPDRSSNVRAWILTIVRNRSIDVIRHNRSPVRQGVSIDTLEHVLSVPDATSAIDSALDGDRIRHALDALPPEQRRVIEFSFYGGMTQREIADRENLPLGTIKGRIRLGLRKLGTMLTTEDPRYPGGVQ